MEELVETVLAGVAAAKEKGDRRYVFFLPETSSESNVELEGLVRPLLPGCEVNHLTIRHYNGRVEKRLIIDW